MSKPNIHLIWTDARLVSPKSPEIEVSRMRTIGMLECETEAYYIIRDPETVNMRTGKAHPEKTPTFYFIPKTMVVEIKS